MDWRSVTSSAGIGIGALIWFVLRQRILEHPLIDVRLFGNAPFTGAVLGMILSVFGLAGSLFFFSQYLQFVKGLTPLQAGLFELPATLGALVASVGSTTDAVLRSRSLTAGRTVGHRAGMAAIALILDNPTSWCSPSR